MAHHYSGPDFSFPHGDARLDLCDLFALPAPGAAGKSILIMDVHPAFGVNPPGPTAAEPFASEGLYELKIDTDGDAVANIAYRIRFAATGDGAQRATVRRAEGTDAAGLGDGGEDVIADAPVSMGREAQVTEGNGYRFFAGWRSDPFFFDGAGAANNFQFTGDDTFAANNVASIVLEIPNAALGPGGQVALWARTVVAQDGAGWVQVDRGARGQQTVFFCPGEEKAAYLAGEPAGDAQFLDSYAHTLEMVGGYTAEEARRVAGTLLPDVLRYDPSRPAAYPDNGRTLTDDVPDHFLPVFTNGKVTTDHVGPHGDLLAEFPYLGPPHGA